MPNLLTPAEAAVILHMSVRTVRRRIRDGSLPAIKLGRKTLIVADEIVQTAPRVHAPEPRIGRRKAQIVNLDGIHVSARISRSKSA